MKTIPIALVAALAISLPFAAGAQDDAPENSVVHSLKRTLGTDAYIGIVKSLATPATYQNPVTICAQCHDAEDYVRYQESLGPSMQMLNPVNWVNPMAYVNMAAPLVDPETYTKWYNAWVEKYGGLLGNGQESDAQTQGSE